MELKYIQTDSNTEGSDGFNRTFMELKLVLAFWRLVCALMFQSYLYGIEICANPNADIYVDARFNRTFMELKSNKIKFYSLCIILFQSYLYGIEILDIADIVQSANCFNRTFMELKFLEDGL